LVEIGRLFIFFYVRQGAAWFKRGSAPSMVLLVLKQ